MLHRSAREEVDGLVSRAQLFAELADIAEKRGDVDRAADLRASAAEAVRAS
jgi:hypothetical protein